MYKIFIKPLSNNQAWKGKRYKTDKYLKYQRYVKILLKKLKFPKLKEKQNFWVYYKFGTSRLQDYDNAIKVWQDLLCTELGIDDRYILGAFIQKEIVKKGEEFIEFEIFKSLEDFFYFIEKIRKEEIKVIGEKNVIT